jgi:hypothetical protein
MCGVCTDRCGNTIEGPVLSLNQHLHRLMMSPKACVPTSVPGQALVGTGGCPDLLVRQGRDPPRPLSISCLPQSPRCRLCPLLKGPLLPSLFSLCVPSGDRFSPETFLPLRLLSQLFPPPRCCDGIGLLSGFVGTLTPSPPLGCRRIETKLLRGWSLFRGCGIWVGPGLFPGSSCGSDFGKSHLCRIRGVRRGLFPLRHGLTAERFVFLAL